jgi:hypothetical protein
VTRNNPTNNFDNKEEDKNNASFISENKFSILEVDDE